MSPSAGDVDSNGNDVDDDACSNDCIKPRLVFVTSSDFKGNLGGLAGADMQCAAAGMTANPNLPATAWRAWLSDDNGSPSTRFDTAFTGWYQLVDGTPIAKGWSDLTDGTLAAPINLTETSAAPEEPLLAWSNTTVAGMNAGPDDCNDWGSANPALNGRFGDVTVANTDWTDESDAGFNPLHCGSSFHLYCFQNAL